MSRRPELFVQNVRLAKAPSSEMERLVRQEAAGRLPFPAAEADIRFLEAADVRQGETTRREVILLACHKPMVDQLLKVDRRRGPVAGRDRRRAGRFVALLRETISPRRRSAATSHVRSHRRVGHDRRDRERCRRVVHQIYRRRRPRNGRCGCAAFGYDALRGVGSAAQQWRSSRRSAGSRNHAQRRRGSAASDRTAGE